MRRLRLAALPLLVAGCTIPGQGLVIPTPQRPSQANARAIAAQADRVPLVTIAAPARPEDYQSALAEAVRQAQQTLAAKALTADATEVAQAIMGDGVPAERITLGAVIVPGIPGDEVRVYVR
jgi:hypothetical protein